jgi:recombination protein RecA
MVKMPKSANFFWAFWRFLEYSKCMIKTNNEMFAEALKNIISQFGKGSLTTLDEKSEKVEVIPSGSISLDAALGCGGYPKGRIIEIYGNESCGKTSISLQAVAQCQKLGGKCAYLDLENSLDPKFCRTNGVDAKELLIAKPDSAEQTFSIIEALTKTGMIDLIVVDSVAAMVPEVEGENEITNQTIGVQARIMSKGLRILQSLMIKYPVTVIFINQIREKIGVMFGNPETTTGGRALRFYASCRIELRKGELLKKDNDIIGLRVAAKVVKNKLGAPMSKANIDIYYDRGIDHTEEIINFAIEKGFVSKKGC